VFDTLYAGELPETREIMIKSYHQWSVREQALDADLAARGVEVQPTDYPWRDDGKLWWPAIQRFVDDYVALFYANDQAVRDDTELQAWIAELQAADGGHLRGLMPGPNLDTVAELTAVLGQFLFTAGPGHAAVHYPQTDYFTYIPAFPGAAYRPPPKDGEPVDEARIVDTLPPFSVGADQFQNNQIAYYRFDKFGDYSKYPLAKVSVAQPLITRLQDDLRVIEDQINTRNRTRARPYEYMLPSLVPNSINI
jgi:arachidonate 15-lipoxygenase